MTNMWTPLAGSFLFSSLWAILANYYRFCIYVYAFNGMRKSDAREIFDAQSPVSKIFMIYLIKCNPTSYRSPDKVVWMLVWFYIYTIVAILFIVTFWLDPRYGWLFDFSRFLARAYLYVPVVSIIASQIFPQKAPPSDYDVVRIKDKKRDKDFDPVPRFFKKR